MKNILFSVENTDPKCYWLVGYLETLLVQVRETQPKYPTQSCKMDCENCDNCEIANCDCEKNTISQITQFSFLTIGRNRNITQFDFLQGRNCESCENYCIEVFF